MVEELHHDPGESVASLHPADHEARREVANLLAAGREALDDRGNLREAREIFLSAAMSALELGDDESLGCAVLGWSGLWVHESRGVIDGLRMQTWRERSLTRLPPSSLTAQRLQLRVAAEADYADGTADRVMELLDAARKGRSSLLLGEALSLTHHCLLGSEHAETRMGLADELVALGATEGRPIDLLMGLAWRTVDLVLAGDPHADRSIQELQDLADSRSHAAVSYLVQAFHTMQAIRSGHLDEAELLAARTYQLGEAAGDMDATGWYGAHLCAIRWYQGRTKELVPLISEWVASPTMAINNEAYLAALAVCAAAAGMRADASSALRRLRGRGLSELRSSSTWLLSMHGAAVAAHMLGDREVAEEVFELLEPFAELPVMASLGISCFGSALLPLGLCVLTSGRTGQGIELIQRAVQHNEALGNVPAKAIALEFLGSVAGSVTDIAVEGLVGCRMDASQWVLTMGYHEAVVADCVGMRYLAVLLKNPGKEIPAGELVGQPQHFVPAQPINDAQALSSYRRRIAELEEEMAAAGGNELLLDKAQREYDALTEEILRSQGLRGRSRSFANADDRARTSVQKAIARALSRVRTANPTIAEAVAGSLSTGFACVYRPRIKSGTNGVNRGDVPQDGV